MEITGNHFRLNFFAKDSLRSYFFALSGNMTATMNSHLCAIAFQLLLYICKGGSVNWAQLAGDRVQNTATPYTPEKWRQQKNMWSGRWGHAVVVFNQSITRSYLTEEENSERARGANPVLVLLGGR